MDSYGIEIKNSEGFILVDGEHPHPTLILDAIANIPAGQTTPVYWTWDMPPTLKPMTFVWSLDTGYIQCFGIRKTNGYYDGMKVSVPYDDPPKQGFFRVYTAGFPVERYSNYGLDIFNSDGERIFGGPTLRVHAMGAIMSMPYDATLWIEFPPTTKRPYMHLSTGGNVWIDGGWWWAPFLGPVEKNVSGEYYRFQVSGRRLGVYSGSRGRPTWYIPWVVFT